MMGKPKSKVVNALVPGLLEQYAPGFRSWLLEQGYTPLTTVPQLQLMAHVSRWLDRERLAVAGLTASGAARFLAAHQAAGFRQPKSAAGLRPLLSYLGGLGVLGPEPPGPAAGCGVRARVRVRGVPPRRTRAGADDGGGLLLESRPVRRPLCP